MNLSFSVVVFGVLTCCNSVWCLLYTHDGYVEMFIRSLGRIEFMLQMRFFIVVIVVFAH